MNFSLAEKNSQDIPSELSIVNLLNSIGIKDGIKDLSPVIGGANNRIYRLQCNDRDLLLKIYFRDPVDPRDRLKTEFLFLKFLWASGIRDVPEPFGCDQKNGMALYEWIEGKKLTPNGVLREHINQAIDFFVRLNDNRNKAKDIPPASEACFSLSEHIETIDKRVRRLDDIEGYTEIDIKAKKFVEVELRPIWMNIKKRIIDLAHSEVMDMEKEINIEDRCLSPSDFGFHNAIVTHEGKLKFIDFEYAGWDDPAKMVCDFFCQPEIPVPHKYFNVFTDKILKVVRDKKNLFKRINMLYPAYQIKWCCIVLNEFLTSDIKRRKFACLDSQIEDKKTIQLKKASGILKNIKI